MESFAGILIIIFLVILQSSVVVHITFLSFVPELLLIFCVFMGTRFDWYKGFWWGVICGISVAAFSFVDMRFSIVVFALCGLIAGSFRGAFFVDHIITKIIILFFISVAEAFLFGVFSKEISLSLFSFAVLQKSIFKIALINCIFAVPLYLFMGKVFKRSQLYEKR